VIERYLVAAGRIRQEVADPERIAHLVQRLHPCFEHVQNELLGFADFLDQLAQED
jgi:hypothetical protein